jgi:N6-L-threonylcarbamoyladenine synthase
MSQASRILAIETSCDETAAAVVVDGRSILSNVIASQAGLHARYGGVFPEVASRRHVEVIYAVVEQALRDAHLGLEDLDCISVTRGPGLVGSLLIGMNMAKGLALGRNKPLLGINHIEGHIYSLWLTEFGDEIVFPILNLVVSGGHTELFLMTDHGRFEHLGGTMDDAAGEAFDKVGRLLGLPYPGGPAIDAAAATGNPNSIRFPRAVMEEEHGYHFSFSGLKTAAMRQIQQYDPERIPVNDLAAGFQAAVVDMLVTKTVQAAADYQAKAVHVVGGVAANSALRQAMVQSLRSQEQNVPVRIPPPIFCTDNAAMIAAAAHWRFLGGQRDSLDLDVMPGWRLT